jgi:hypothetical protein
MILRIDHEDIWLQEGFLLGSTRNAPRSKFTQPQQALFLQPLVALLTIITHCVIFSTHPEKERFHAT